MQLSGEKLIEAPRPKVWAALTDPAFLTACRPDHEIPASDSTRLDGTVRLSDLDPPSACTVFWPGQAESAPIRVRLYDTTVQTTRLTYEAAGEGGGAAQENFFARFAAAVSQSAPAAGPRENPEAHVVHPEPYHPPAHEDHDHDPSNPHYFGLPLGVILAGIVAAVSVCVTIVKFLL